MGSQGVSDSTCSVRDKEADITIAAELKFLVRQSVEDITSKYGQLRTFVPYRPKHVEGSLTASETRLRQDTWDAIAKAIDSIPGINATSQHQSQEERTEHWKSLWMVYRANSACPMFMTYINGDPDFPYLDESAPDFGKYVWTPVEICSPILSWPRKTEALNDLTRILDTLNEQFDAVANPSTEVHIHVGRADGKFYALNTMKKLATIFWLAEPVLRAVKDPKSANYDHHYTYSYPLRPNSRISKAINGRLPSEPTVDSLFTGGPDDFDDFLVKLEETRLSGDHEGYSLLEEDRQALRAIWRAADHNELAHMLRGPDHRFRRLGFNFFAIELAAKGESPPRTIEFRFLEGFIDASVVPAWARLCGEILGVVVDREDDGEENMEFYEVVAAILSAPKDLPMDAQFAAFMLSLGRDRIPQSVSEPLVAVVRANYTPRTDGV